MLPTDRVRTSPASCTTTALQGNEYEIHNRHAFAHDICHNCCGCAGWNRTWPPQVAGHRHATAGTCADDCSVERAAVEAFPAQVGISFNDEIAADRSRQGLRGLSERVRSAHFARPRRSTWKGTSTSAVSCALAALDVSDAASSPLRPPQWFLHTPLQEVISEEHPWDAAHEVARAFGGTVRAESTAGLYVEPDLVHRRYLGVRKGIRTPVTAVKEL